MSLPAILFTDPRGFVPSATYSSSGSQSQSPQSRASLLFSSCLGVREGSSEKSRICVGCEMLSCYNDDHRAQPIDGPVPPLVLAPLVRPSPNPTLTICPLSASGNCSPSFRPPPCFLASSHPPTFGPSILHPFIFCPLRSLCCSERFLDITLRVFYRPSSTFLSRNVLYRDLCFVLPSISWFLRFCCIYLCVDFSFDSRLRTLFTLKFCFDEL